MPAFNVFEMPERRSLYECLGLLPPGEAYALMGRLHGREREELLHDDVEALRRHARARVTLAPRVTDEYDVEQVVAQFATYPARLQLDCVFLVTFMAVPGALEEIVDFGNIDVLEQLVARGDGVLLLPLHIGPSYAALPVLATRLPLTTLFHQLNFHEIKEAFFPHIDIEALAVPDRRILLRCLRVLKAGRALSMFPELSPGGIDKTHVPVPFMGTKVAAPGGPVLLAERTRTPMLPFTFRRTGPARYAFTFHEPLAPPAGEAERSDTLTRLFARIESEVLAEAPGDWEMWYEFERMLDTALEPVA